MCRWNSHYFTECIIEHTSGSEPATLVKLGDIALVVVYQAVIFAEDEDDALNQLEEQLKEQNIAHGMCMAEEV